MITNVNQLKVSSSFTPKIAAISNGDDGNTAFEKLSGSKKNKVITILNKTANYSLVADDNCAVVTNAGAIASVIVTLPPSNIGDSFVFRVMAGVELKIKAATGETINISGSVSSTGGTASSSTIGDTVNLTSINTTEWVTLVSEMGIWVTA